MTTRHRQGLRTLSPDLIAKASEGTAAQVNRVGLTFLGTAAFCLLSLFSPDSALLGGSEKINVPLAGPVSFFGFMLLGPAFLIGLRIYLQIYVEHGDRLNWLAQRMPAVRAPTLVPLKNLPIRVVSGFIFYLLLPMAMLLFAWKAAVFPIWGSSLFCVALGVIASHAMLSLRRFSWLSRFLLSVAAAVLAGGMILGAGTLLQSSWVNRWGSDIGTLALGPLRLQSAPVSHGMSLLGRPFNLFRADLSGQYLFEIDLTKAMLRAANLNGAVLAKVNLTGADMIAANLSGANLLTTNLSGAYLLEANLSGADLRGTNLSGAYLLEANLSGADLGRADLGGANLSGADLHAAKNLSQAQLDKACGIDAKLPASLTPLKPCPAK